MSHLPLLPVLVPLLTGGLLLLLDALGLRTQRTLSLLASLALVPVAFALVDQAAAGDIISYYVGDWPAPFGIVLVVDRLSAMLLLLSAVLGAAATVYAAAGDDTQGPRFHALLQFQLLGINGAFLTGDLFNLFVCFEILLIASYGLLMHGGGKARTAAALHVVALNLAGSAVFLVGIGCIYAATGTLNFADLGARVAETSSDTQLLSADTQLLKVGALLLLLVFALKAAAVPLGFWLPRAYGFAAAPVACVFAIMTKVGVYAIARVHGAVLGGGALEGAIEPWLLPVGLVTVVVGTLGALAARHLGLLVANLVVVSAGTLIATFGVGSTKAVGGALFYLLHSTLVAGGLFLLVDLVVRQRGGHHNESGVDWTINRPLVQPVLLGILFLVGLVAVVGLPPLSGFAAKLWILQSAVESGAGATRGWVLGVLLASGLLTLLALARVFSALFWRSATAEMPDSVKHGVAAPAPLGAAAALLACSFVLIVAGRPIGNYVESSAAQLADRSSYIDSVLSNEGVGWTDKATGEVK